MYTALSSSRFRNGQPLTLLVALWSAGQVSTEVNLLDICQLAGEPLQGWQQHGSAETASWARPVIRPCKAITHRAWSVARVFGTPRPCPSSCVIGTVQVNSPRKICVKSSQ